MMATWSVWRLTPPMPWLEIGEQMTRQEAADRVAHGLAAERRLDTGSRYTALPTGKQPSDNGNGQHRNESEDENGSD